MPPADQKPQEPFRSLANATGATSKIWLMAAASLTNERARTEHVIRDSRANMEVASWHDDILG